MQGQPGNWWREGLLATGLIAVAVGLLYGHTLQVPFYLDDHGFIVENFLVRDLPEALRRACAQRGLTTLSFACNYRFTGLSLPPLHLTNIALHALCGMLVWGLLRQLLQGRVLPLLGALLFVGHPLQTQGVTYLTQRATVLGTCFFLVTFLCHLRVRTVLAEGAVRCSPRYLVPYLAAVSCGVFALLAKESAAVLPLVLIAWDRLFPPRFPRSRRQACYDYLPFFVTPLLLGFGVFSRLATGTEMTSQAGAIISLSHNNPLNYLVTQFSVFWVYLRLLLLPYGQALEHDFPVAETWATPQSAVALAGLLVLVWILWRQRRTRPLLVFGAIWFACGLLVESSVIPLDPLFEHRLYLPLFGFVLVLLDGVPALLGERRAWALFIALLLLWMPLSWRRNVLWNEPSVFYRDNLRVAPHSERVSLALLLLDKTAGHYAAAEARARALIEANPRFNVAWQELVELLARRGAQTEALAVIDSALHQLPNDAELYRSGAMLRLNSGEPEAAVAFLLRGVAGASRNPRMYGWLGALYFELGQLSQAEAAYRESLRLAGKVAATHKNLAKVLHGQGRWTEARQELRIALEMTPGDPDILEGLIYCSLASGDREGVAAALAKLRFSDPVVWQALQRELAAENGNIFR